MEARLEKTLKRENGERIKIICNFRGDYRRSRYEVQVLHCDKGKRTWKGCCDTEHHMFRRLSIEERSQAVEKSYLNYVTEQEILDAKLELWELMKPERR